jgi:serine/threonine protein phosphatase PrpC
VYDLTGPGWVVLCTDGFWNYFSAASALSSLVQAAGNGASAARVARLLVNRAIARGGHDNTTVLVYQHV